MQDYKPNSNKSKQEALEKKEVKKVISGTATRRKNEVRKLTDIFVHEDISNVKTYVFMDILVPAIKKAISDIVTDGVDMILFGGTTNHNKKGNTINGSYKNYVSFSSNNRDTRDRGYSRDGYSYDDIRYETRGEAEAVLNQMDDILDQYQEVTVLDYYDLSGVTGNFTDNKYGWTDLRSASVERLRGGGYIIKLPRARVLDR